MLHLPRVDCESDDLSVANVNAAGRPEFQLKTVRVIRSPALGFAETGRLDELRSLYNNGHAGVHDVDPPDGKSALMVHYTRLSWALLRYVLTFETGCNQRETA